MNSIYETEELDTVRSERRPAIKRVILRNVFETEYVATEAYKSLRTNIQFCGSDIKVIAVTSCMANEGKSTCSLELAKSLAELNHCKVLFIDADLRKSTVVSQYVRQPGIEGLSQYLSGQATLQDVLYTTQIPNLYMIFAGHYPPNPVELIESGMFQTLIENARKNFDYIILDTPPLGLVIDAAVAARYCDGAILVLHSGQIKYSFAQDVKEQLSKSGCRILGVVLNQVEYAAGRYGKYKKYTTYRHDADFYGPEGGSGNAGAAGGLSGTKNRKRK